MCYKAFCTKVEVGKAQVMISEDAPTLLPNLVTAGHVSVVITDPRQPDNPIVECSDRFLELTGYSRDEVIGRNCRFLAGPDTTAQAQELIRNAVQEQRPGVFELVNYRKDGTPFLNSLMIAPIYDADSRLIGYIGTQLEVRTEVETFVRKRENRARKLVRKLTPRQVEVLSLFAHGYRVKQIANELGLSERTVKMHLANMRERLEVTTNTEAIRLAVRSSI